MRSYASSLGSMPVRPLWRATLGAKMPSVSLLITRTLKSLHASLGCKVLLLLARRHLAVQTWQGNRSDEDCYISCLSSTMAHGSGIGAAPQRLRDLRHPRPYNSRDVCNCCGDRARTRSHR